MMQDFTLRLVLLLPLLARVNSIAFAQDRAARLNPVVTEEGQHVVFDAYTWQRRELDKRLPLDQAWPDLDHIAAEFAEFGLDKMEIPQYIPVPALILPDIYLISSHPTLTYLIDCGPEGVAVVDPGIEQNYSSVIANIEKLGYKTSQIRWGFNTHAHFDHSGSDYQFQKLGAQILIGEKDVSAIENQSLVTALNFVNGPDTPPFHTATSVRPLFDGEIFKAGNKSFNVIHTPGHTDGASCFYLRIGDKNVLFSGDTVLYDYRLGAQVMAYSDNAAYIDSLRKLARFHLYLNGEFRWDVLLPGHGTIVLDRAYMDVQKAWNKAELDIENRATIDAMPFETIWYRVLMYGRP